MTKSIRAILKPLLVISYVFGLRIANLSKHLKLFNILYMLLIWSLYYFAATSTLMSNFNERHPTEDVICSWYEILSTLLIIVFGLYHEKVRKC